ncbi:MAG: hypothetical protein IPK82_02785 [Polyangiaceae bacterium]|nr:hypothetical protein [Polyangiaceae bacterium]
MTARTVPLTDPGLAAYDRLDLLVWVADIDDWHVCWGNHAALRFWNIPSRDFLAYREFPASDTVRALHFHVREQLKTIPFVRMEQTVYPDNRAPVRLAFSFSTYPLPSGRIGLLVEAREVQSSDHELLRRLDAIRYAPLVVTTHSTDGSTLSANAHARLTFGNWFTLQTLFARQVDADRCLDWLLKGQHLSEDVELLTLNGTRWFALEARSIIDPVNGLSAILVAANDVTARRDAERSKDELVSVVSHELRTPLTSIHGALRLLSAGVVADDPKTESELMQIAHENVVRLTKLVDDLLDVQRLSFGVLELNTQRCNLSRLIQNAIDMHSPIAASQGVAITFDAPPQVFCHIDSSRIDQVILNLLSNALKHSAKGQTVQVTVRRLKTTVRVNIIDHGSGVPKHFKTRIFGVFEQADTSDDRRLGGAGLGLHIAKTLIERHGGTMGYDDTRAQGAHFYFELPLDPDPLP